ncbi:MAG: hypothetical protein WC307_02185 [Candidatus Nanoarchaeia archaeon]
MRKNFLVICLFAIISILVTWRILAANGAIGYRHDWSIPQFGEMITKGSENLFYVWNERDLGTTWDYQSVFFFYAGLGLLSSIGLGGVFLTRMLIVAFVFCSAYFMFLLSRHVLKNNKAGILSGLLYALNPIVFNRVVAGHITYLFSYMLAPLLFLSFIKSKDNKTNLILSIILITFTVTQLQFFIMVPLLMICYSIFMRDKKLFFNSLVISASLLLTHSFWLMPILLNFGTSSSTINYSTSIDIITRNAPPFFAVPLLIGAKYFVDAIWNWLLIPVIGGGALILILLLPNIKSKDKQIWFFIITTAIGLFLSKGPNPPFGEAFLNIPLIGLFRESQHLLFIPAFCYALLLGSSYNLLKSKRILFPIAIILFALPLFSGNFMGQLQDYQWSNGYGEITNSLINDPSDYRVLYFPLDQPISMTGLDYAGIDPMITYSPKSSLNQVISVESDSNRVTAFLSNLIRSESDSNLSSLLRLLNIKYVISRDDFISEFGNYSIYARNYPEVVSSFGLSKTDYLKSQLNETKITMNSYNNIKVFEVNNSLPVIYAAEHSSLVDSNINNLLDYNCSKPAIFFAIQQDDSALVNLVDEINDNTFDSELINSTKLKPSEFITTSNASNGWARLFDYSFGWWWYNVVYTSGIDSSIITLMPNSIVTIPINTSGGLYIKFTGSIIANSIASNSTDIAWHYFGSATDRINITSNGEALLASIAISNDLETIEQKNNNAVHEADISFIKTNPAEYNINVNNSEPFFLVFSESYDEDWIAESNNTKFNHFVVNGFANAFYINETGSYTVRLYQSEQLTYSAGISISLVTLILLIITLLPKILSSNHTKNLYKYIKLFFVYTISTLKIICFNILLTFKHGKNAKDYPKKIKVYKTNLKKFSNKLIKNDLIYLFLKEPDNNLLALSFFIIIISGFIVRLNRLIGGIIGIIGYFALCLFVILKIKGNNK